MTSHRITILPFAAPESGHSPESARIARGLSTLMEARLRDVPGSMTFLQHFLLRSIEDATDLQYANRTTLWTPEEVLLLPSPEDGPATHFVYGSLVYGEEINFGISVVDVEERRVTYRHEATVPKAAFIESFFPLLPAVARTIEPRTPARVLRELGKPGTHDLLAFQHYLIGLSQRSPVPVGGGEENPFHYFETALSRDPGFIDPCVAIDALAQECFRDHHDEERALEVLRRAATEVEHFPRFRRTLGVYLYDRGQFEEARYFLEAYLGGDIKGDAAAPGAFVRLASLYRRDDGVAAALALLQRAAQLFPRDPELIEVLGICHHETGNSNAAERCWRRALEDEPERPVSLSHLGLLLWKRGDAKRARILLDRSIESLNAGHACFVRVLDFLLEAGDLKRADEVATEWVERFVAHWPAWLRLAHVRLARGASDEALYCIGKAEELATDDEALDQITLAHFALDHPEDYALYLLADDAEDSHQSDLASLRELALRHPNHAFLWFAHARAADRAGESEEAFEAQRRGLALKPDAPNQQHRHALLAERAGRLAEAIAAYSKVVEEKPDDEMSRHALIRLLLGAGQNDAARYHLAVGMEKHPDDARWEEYAATIRATAAVDPSSRQGGAVQRLIHLLHRVGGALFDRPGTR